MRILEGWMLKYLEASEFTSLPSPSCVLTRALTTTAIMSSLSLVMVKVFVAPAPETSNVCTSGSNWNEEELLAGTVYVDGNGFLKVSKKEAVQP